MYIESIKSIIHSMSDTVKERKYITVTDGNHKEYLRIVEFVYKLYDKVGKIETENHKGTKIDKKV